MGSSNLPLITYYAVFIIVGALLNKKKRWLGALIGGAVAMALITIFALLIGG